mgnify:CR=1 FL=1
MRRQRRPSADREGSGGDVFQAALRAELTKGDSFAAARQRAVAALLSPSDAALLSDPNNILGIEYCRALLRVGAAPALFTIPRTGAAHDAAPENAGGYSAPPFGTCWQKAAEPMPCPGWSRP